MRSLFFACLLLCLSPVQAASLSGFTEEFAPFNFSEGHETKGLANEILDRIAARTGIEISRRSLPWLRAVQSNANEPDSLLYTTVRTPQRENQYLWVGPYDDCDIVFIKLAGRTDVLLGKIPDAEHYRIGTARGAAGEQILRSIGFDMSHVDVSSPEEERSVRMLYANRFDLSVGVLLSHVFLARKLGLDASQLESALTLSKGFGCYFAFNPKVNPDLFNRFHNAFEAMRQSGELEQIRRRYLPNGK